MILLKELWPIIVSISIVIVALTKFILDFLKIRELRLKTKALTKELKYQEPLIQVATKSEIEKYGKRINHYKNNSRTISIVLFVSFLTPTIYIAYLPGVKDRIAGLAQEISPDTEVIIKKLVIQSPHNSPKTKDELINLFYKNYEHSPSLFIDREPVHISEVQIDEVDFHRLSISFRNINCHTKIVYKYYELNNREAFFHPINNTKFCK